MADKINLGSSGPDSIKGSVFFGSSLTPAGTFKNVPLTVDVDPAVISRQEPSLVLTLQQLEEQLQRAAKQQQGVSDDPLSEQSINTFLGSYVKLLIDYRDLRNFVFFGSAYNELSYHINYLTTSYPFKSFVAKDVNIGNAPFLEYESGKSIFSFNETDILQQANYNYDLSGKTIWPEYDIVDQNGTRFPITEFNQWSFTVDNAFFASGAIRIEGTIINPALQNVSLNGSPFVAGKKVRISGVQGVTNANNTPSNPEWTITGVSNFAPGKVRFNLVGSVFAGTFIPSPDAVVETDVLSLTCEGAFSANNFVEYRPTNLEFFKGFVISPKIQVLNDFYYNIEAPQKELLSKSNPTPWPRYDVTDNLYIDGPEFQEWLETPSNTVLSYNTDEFGVIENPIPGEYNLVGALSLDEIKTNQLLRRAIPEQIVNEFNDADGYFFSRFILLAGKMFDTIKVYIDFLKYTKTLNYTPYNQLSPEYFKEYANHYGFDLYDDDSVSFADAIIRTEPGLRYDSSNNPIFDDQATEKTVQELQYEKQRRLLINLFYLYSKKGTQIAIQSLTSLLGSPKGLVEIAEFFFDRTTGGKLIDNDKVHTPNVSYEIDPEYLVNPSNVDDPINLPYVYRMKLDNESKTNLREMSINTNPQQALLEQMLGFGEINYPLAKFGANGFASLTSSDTDGFFLLPLTFPDKFTGITVEYLLPRNGRVKGEGNNNSESSIHIGSLYKTNIGVSLTSGNVNKIAAGTKFGYQLPEVFDNISNDYAAREASCKFKIIDFPTGIKSIQVKVNGVVIGTSVWFLSKKQTALNIVNEINFGSSTFKAVYKELENDEYEITIISTGNTGFTVNNQNVEVNIIDGFVITPDYTNISWPSGQKLKGGWPLLGNDSASNFIIARQEGTDAVIRLRLKEEKATSPIIFERVCLIPNIFNEDGLLHQLRLVYRPEGVEAYQDFKFLGLFRWKDPSTATDDMMVSTPYTVMEIPKHRINTCDTVGMYIVDGPDAGEVPDDFFDFGTNNNTNEGYIWWDLVIGFPTNSDMYFKRVAVHELPSIDNPDSLDFGIDSSGLETEKYSFDFTNQKTTNSEYEKNLLYVPATYTTSYPELPGFNTAVADYFTNTYSDIITEMVLVNHNYLNGEVIFSEDIQDFYKLPVSNGDNLFTYNAWSSTIHKDYAYDNYNNGLVNYEVYSTEVVTYLSLLSFMELVEDKFRPLIKQFIPIVINLSSFGRIIKSFEKKKVRYPKIDFQCEGTINPSNAVGLLQVVNGRNNYGAYLNNNLSIQFISEKRVIDVTNTTPINIVTLEEHGFTTGDTITISGVAGTTNANGAWTITVIDDNTFSLDTSIGNGDFNPNSDVTLYREDILIGPIDWNGSNSQTSNDIVSTINGLASYPDISASLSGGLVQIEVDPEWYLTNYGQNINDVKLTISVGDPAVVVDNVVGFYGGAIEHAGNTCIQISYSTPTLTIPFAPNYIYFESENAPVFDIYFESEGAPPFFID